MSVSKTIVWLSVYCMTKKFSVVIKLKRSSLLLHPNLNKFNPVHIFITYFSIIHFNIILPRASGVAKWHFP
jgi:hypothetical protein